MSRMQGADLKGFVKRSEELADRIVRAKCVEIVSHIDADGITSGAIAKRALKRAGIKTRVHFVKSLGENTVKHINSCPAELVWLTDLGSGYTSVLKHPGLMIADHHVPERLDLPAASKRRTLFDYDEQRFHLNPHLFGFDGSKELSGAGAAYFVAKAISPANMDLSPLAIVGAVGDFQDNQNNRLVGLNSIIKDDAVAGGWIECVEDDLRLFGKETRPLAKMLQYANDPHLPGLSNDWQGCYEFLRGECRLRLRDRSDKLRCWCDLDKQERLKVIEGLKIRLGECGSLEAMQRLCGEVYLLSNEKKGTPLREAKEYATLLNSCGRYGNADIGLKVCLGDRGEEKEKALEQLQNHRGFLVNAMNYLLEGKSKEEICERMASIQVLLGDNGYLLPENVERKGANGELFMSELLRDTNVGIVAGMVLGSGKVNGDVPLIAMIGSEDNKVKVSARGNQAMLRRGLDLSKAMKSAAARVGGIGGGHDIAAGATIPPGKEKEFLAELDRLIGEQLRP